MVVEIPCFVLKSDVLTYLFRESTTIKFCNITRKGQLKNAGTRCNPLTIKIKLSSSSTNVLQCLIHPLQTTKNEVSLPHTSISARK